jgi:glycoprotein endo-alpha-1,2-mannosidase
MKISFSHLFNAIILIVALSLQGCDSKNGSKKSSNSFEIHTMSPGLVMAGYQGWFNAPTDGADRGWYHYSKGGRFEPGHCTIDMWPDMSEYEKQYETPFLYADGTAATLFSSNDESTVRLHFRWMKEYGIDGVFMQRFVGEVKRESGRNHFNKVLQSATKAALEYDRTVAVMYDLSGMRSEDTEVLIEDWKTLINEYGFGDRTMYPNYLFNEGKPLVAVWGVGFNDNRRYNLDDIEKIVQFLKSAEGGNCSVMLGVPTYWREQGNDCIKDEKLHEVIQMADVVHPWFVGRYDEERYDGFKSLIGKDKAWCDAHNLKYIPLAFPGFSWYNMYPDSKNSFISRNSGHFFWKQLSGIGSEGGEMIYVAMFDEVDEGTAIFKVAKEVPVGESVFVPLDEDTPTDHYLWLTGQAAGMLKQKQPLPAEKPVQNR